MKTKIILIFTALLFSISGIRCSNNEKEFTIWIGGSPEEVDFWETLVSKFNEQTSSNLKLVRQPTYTDQRQQELIISLEANQPNPDLFLMDVVWINQFIKSNWLEPLDNYVTKNDFDTDVFFPKVLNSVDRYKNKLYALPVFLDVGLLYYRKDLLNKYGFASPPQTWNELINQSLIIQKAERKYNHNFYGFVWQGAQYEGLVCDFLEFIASNGGSILKDGKINLDTPENEKALQLMVNLIHKHKISPINTYTEMKEEEVRRAFQRGDALFERNWTYAWKLAQGNDSQVKGKTGLTVLPHFDGNQSVSTLGGWHIGISRFSDEKEKAWKFIQFVSSYEVQKSLVLNVGWNPARKDVYHDKDIIAQLPTVKILYDALQNTVARPTLPYYSQVSDIIQRYVNDCLSGKIKPAAALKKMQNECEKFVEIYGSK